ncbi:MAG: hypothetical protein FWE04_07900 [Oscillospiraceae bacterium]|nr:hypothetical protein [Oscillospiraceae bacterium]
MKKIFAMVLCVILCLSLVLFIGTAAGGEYTVGDLIRVSDYTEIRILGVRYEEVTWDPGRHRAIVSAEIFTTAVPTTDIRFGWLQFFGMATTDTSNMFGGTIPGIHGLDIFVYPNERTYVEVAFNIPENMILSSVGIHCPIGWNPIEVTIPPPDDMPIIPVTTASTAQVVNGNIVLDVQVSTQITSEALHVAVYDESDRLLNHIIIPVTRPLRSFYAVFDDMPNASYAKVFLWNSFETMTPITGAERVDIRR